MWTDDYARQLNTRVVLAILESLFQSRVDRSNSKEEVILFLEFPVCVFLESAVEIFFEEFSQTARSICEQSGRTLGNWFDVDFALEKFFGKQLSFSDLLHLARHVDTGKYPVYKRKRIPSNPLASEEGDLSNELTPRERWMPPLPPPYTYRVHQVYYPTRIHRLEDERQAFLEQKLQVEEILLAEEDWTRSDATLVCNTDILPRFSKPVEDDNLAEEKELLEFLFDENLKEQSIKATENIKVDRQMLVQRFERIMNDVDTFIE